MNKLLIILLAVIMLIACSFNNPYIGKFVPDRTMICRLDKNGHCTSLSKHFDFDLTLKHGPNAYEYILDGSAIYKGASAFDNITSGRFELYFLDGSKIIDYFPFFLTKGLKDKDNMHLTFKQDKYFNGFMVNYQIRVSG